MATTKTPKKNSSKKPSKKAGAQAPKMPTSQEVAELIGVQIAPPLKTEQIARLRRAVPGYAGLLDDVALMLEHDAHILNLDDITPEGLLEAQTQQKHLAAREAIAYAVYRSVFEQRLQVDDRAMKMLEKIARRVKALEESNRELPARWKLLLDFLGTFHGAGGRPAGNGRKAAPIEAPADA